ncbi:MAG: FecR domain-containing protein, partial [Thermoanaerobaculia bacterium]
ALAASLLVALLLGWRWTARRAPGSPEMVASVERATGEVRVRNDRGPAEAIGAGTHLPVGALLETSDGGGRSASRALLRLTGGGSVRLDSGTRVRLTSSRQLELVRGALYFDSGAPAAAGGAVEVATAFGIVRDVGTQFEVRLSGERDGVRVRVREGRVALDAEGASHSATGGEELSLRPDGSVVRATVARSGPDWDWVLATAPSFEIEGRSLPAYLDWIGRETGWDIRYESDALAASAKAIRLHGTIAALTLEESLSLVLPGSGLAYRLEDGTLWVTRPPAQNS